MAFTVIPSIDLRRGRVVRLREGDYLRETDYGTDPVAVAKRFAADGARWLHVVDLDAARDEPRQAASIEAIVAAMAGRLACQVGGGLRDAAAVAATLDAGAARAVLGTAAIVDRALVAQLIERHGPDRIVVALDVRGGRAVGGGWLPGAPDMAVEDALDGLGEIGVGTFVVTAIARDGGLGGPDLDLLARVVAAGRGRVIASGGVSSIADLEAVRDLGCEGAIVGRAIYEGSVDLQAAIRAVDEAIA